MVDYIPWLFNVQGNVLIILLQSEWLTITSNIQLPSLHAGTPPQDPLCLGPFGISTMRSTVMSLTPCLYCLMESSVCFMISAVEIKLSYQLFPFFSLLFSCVVLLRPAWWVFFPWELSGAKHESDFLDHHVQPAAFCPMSSLPQWTVGSRLTSS